MPKPTEKVSSIIVLEESEEILTGWEGNVETIGKTTITKGRLRKRQKTVDTKEKENGILVLTNRRLLWATARGVFGKSYHITHEIPLEDIKGISSGGALRKYISLRDSYNEYRFHLDGKYSGLEEFNPLIQTAMNARKEEIQAEKRKERVHLMIDFSALQDYMKKGGLVLQSVKCPTCSAPLSLPEKGNQTVCGHCGNTVYAQDIFQRVKELIG